MKISSSYQLIYDVVRRVPSGKLATYGQIAKLAGCPGHARQVGYALHALPEDTDVPWHRVISAQGEISLRSDILGEDRQALCLAEEGLFPSDQSKYDLLQYQWEPGSRE
jgi:methylated-DNA-protein-cysteine methyltransferase-like protein